MTCPGCGAPDDQTCRKGCPETTRVLGIRLGDNLPYPADAVRLAHTRGVEQTYKLTDVRRAFMEGVIALCEFRKEPAPQWMVETLWQDSATRQWAERRLQQS